MENLIRTIVQAIEDKKGKDIVSLDLTGFDGAICSHFVVCNADSTTQVAAIADGIEEKVAEVLGEHPWRVEGQQNAVWIALDYVDARLPDRAARLLPARRAVGRRAADPLRIRRVIALWQERTIPVRTTA